MQSRRQLTWRIMMRNLSLIETNSVAGGQVLPLQIYQPGTVSGQTAPAVNAPAPSGGCTAMRVAGELLSHLPEPVGSTLSAQANVASQGCAQGVQNIHNGNANRTCTENGGTWNSSTNTCTPDPNSSPTP